MTVPGKSRGEMSEAELLAARRSDKRKKAMRDMGRPYNVLPHELEQARRKLVDFHSRGMGYADMDKQVPGPSVRHILGDVANGRRGTVRRSTYEMIMGLRFELADDGAIRGGAPMDSTGTVRRIQALRALGFPENWLSSYGGFSAPQNIRWRAGLRIFRSQRDRVAEMYAKLHDRKPEEFGIPAPALARVRTINRKHNFPGPGCWDDETIDDPDADPEWTGACGTSEGYRVHIRETFFNDNPMPLCDRCRAAVEHTDPATPNRIRLDLVHLAQAFNDYPGTGLEMAEAVFGEGEGKRGRDTLYRWRDGSRSPRYMGHVETLAIVLDVEPSFLVDQEATQVEIDRKTPGKGGFNPFVLAAALDIAKMSFSEAARLPGCTVTKSAINSWTQGVSAPQQRHKVQFLADHFGVDIDVFYS